MGSMNLLYFTKNVGKNAFHNILICKISSVLKITALHVLKLLSLKSNLMVQV